MKHKIFTIENGKVTEGSLIDTLVLKDSGVEVPAVIIGEEGRGRSRGIITIQGLHEDADRLIYANIGQTKAGKPKFVAADAADTDERIIVAFRTPIGFGGSNAHSGDIIGWACECGSSGDGTAPKKCSNPECSYWDGPKNKFSDFPGEILATGEIAQGAAGRAGYGEQHIAVMTKDVVFRTAYRGRRYGAPSAHYYLWDGKQLLSATWDERAAIDIF